MAEMDLNNDLQKPDNQIESQPQEPVQEPIAEATSPIEPITSTAIPLSADTPTMTTLDFTDPGKPLDKLESLLKARKQLYDDLQAASRHIRPDLIPDDYSRRKRINDFKEAYDKADKAVQDELKNIDPVMNKIKNKLLSYGVKDYTTESASGNIEPNKESIIKSARLYTKMYGGSDMVQHELEKLLTGAVYTASMQPAIEQEFNKQVEQVKKAIPGFFADISASKVNEETKNIMAQAVAKNKAALDDVSAKINAFKNEIDPLYQSAIASVNDKYLSDYNTIVQNVAAQRAQDNNSVLHNVQSDYEQQIKDGKISPFDAQQKIKDFMREKSLMDTSSASSIEHEAQQVFNQTMGPKYAEELNQIVNERTLMTRNLNLEAKQAQQKVKDDYGVMMDKFKRDLEADQNLNERKLKILWQKAADNVLSKRDEREKVYQQYRYALADALPGSQAVGTASIFMDKAAESLGGAIEDMGQYLRSIGVNSPFIDDILIGKGAELSLKKRMYQPEFGWKNLFDINYLASNTGNVAGTALPTFAIAALTEGSSFLTNTFSVLFNSAMNAGDTYKESIARGDNEEVASEKANKMFVLDTFTAPLQMADNTIYTSFFKKGKGGVKLVEVGLSSLGEMAQEMVETPLQSSIVEEKPFMKEFRTPATLEAGAQALFGTLTMGGALHVMNKVIGKKAAPSINIQWITDNLRKISPEQMKMYAEKEFAAGNIDEKQLNDFKGTVDIVSKKLSEAKTIGLPDTRAQQVIALGSEIEDLKGTEISDPGIKKAMGLQVKQKEDELSKVIEGKKPIATIEAAGRTFVVDPKEAVDAVVSDPQAVEAVKSGEVKITIEGDDQLSERLQNAVQPSEVNTENIVNNKNSEDAIQEQSTTESVLRDEGVQREGELQGVVSQDQPKVSAEEGQKGEIVNDILNVKGENTIVAGIKNAVVDHPDDAIKEIYQQAIDPKSENLTRETFGSELVDKVLAYGDKQPSFAMAGFIRVDGKTFKGYQTKDQINQDMTLITGTLKGQKTVMTEEGKRKKVKIVEAKLKDARQRGLISEDQQLTYEDKLNEWKAEHPLQESAVPTEPAPVEQTTEPAAEPVTEEAPMPPTEEKPSAEPGIKEKAKSIADKIRDHVKNIGDNAAFEGTLGIPVAIYKGALLAAANIIEAGGTVVDAINEALKQWKDANPNQLNKFKEHLEAMFAPSGDFAVEEQPQETISNKDLFTQLFRKRFYNQKEGGKNMAKAIREAQDAVVKHFKENGIDMRKSTVKRVLKKMNILTRLTKRAEVLSDVLEDIDALVLQEKNHVLVGDTKNALKKLKKLKKSVYLTATDASFIKALASAAPNPRKILLALGADGLKSYYDTLNKLRDAFTGKAGRDAKDAILRQMKSFDDAINTYDQMKLEQKVADMIEDGDLPPGTTVEEYLASLEPRKKADSTAGEARKEMEEFVGQQLDGLEDYETEDARHKDIISKLLSIDIKELKTEDLKLLNNIINNIVNDNDFSASLKFISKHVTAPSMITNIKDLVVKRVTNKILFIKEFAATKNFDNLLNSLFYNNQSRRKFRAYFFGNYESGTSRSIKKIDAIADNLGKLWKKAKITQEENAQLNIYFHLRQLAIDTPEAMTKEFNDELDHIISNSVERLYADGAKLGDIKGRELMRQATETAKALKNLGLIDDYSSDGGQLVAMKKDGLTHENIPVLNERLKNIADYMDEQLASNQDDFLFYSNAVYDTDTKPIPGYFPKMAFPLPSSTSPVDMGALASLDIHGEYKPRTTKQPLDRSKKRTGAGEDKYYRMDALTGFMEGMYQSILLSETKSAMMDIANVLGSKEFQQFIKGEYNPKPIIDLDNYNQFRNAVEEIVNAKKHQPFNFTNTNPRFQVMADWFLSKMVRTYLNRTDQWGGQYIPGLIANMAHVRIGALAHAIKMQGKFVANPDYREAFNKLFSNSTISHRITAGIPLLEKAYSRLSNIPDADASVTSKVLYELKDNAQAIDEFTNDISSWSLQKADYASSFTAAVSGYIDSLIDQGLIESPADFDVFKEAEHPNQEALAGAEGVSAYVNSSSDKSYMASVLKGGSQSDPAMKQTIRSLVKYLYFLKPFNLNGFKNFVNEANILSSYLTKKVAMIRKPVGYGEGVATKEDAMEAIAHMSGYAAQSLAYTSIRVLVMTMFYKLGQQVLEAVFNDLPGASESEEDKKKREQKFWAQIWPSVASDVLLGGAPSGAEDVIKGLGNDAWNMYSKSVRKDMKEKGEKSKGTIYDANYKLFYTGEGMGAAGAYADYVQVVRDILKDEDIKDPELKKAMKTLDWAALAPILLNSGDLRKLRNEMEKRLRFIKEKTEHNASKSFGGFRSGFDKGFGGSFKKGFK